MYNKFIKKALLTAAVLIVSGSFVACDMSVGDLNNPSISELQSSPTTSEIASASQGLLSTTRSNVAEMVQWMGAFGREGYPMSQTGASLSGSVQNQLDGNNFPGTTLWETPYRNIRNANLLLDAVENAEEGVLSSEEKAATRGFAKTIQAYDFLNIYVTRFRFGAPIDVGGDPTEEPAPIVSQSELGDHVATLLDQGRSDLEDAGGVDFAFSLTSGLTDFNTPAAFIQLNRALRARLAVYRDEWSVALDALDQSFIDTTQALDRGAYHVFSAESGDQANPLNRPDFLYAHPRLLDEAQTRSNGNLDLRAQQKLRTVEPFTAQGVTSDLQFELYTSASDPIPWVKNEELILLRAEANIGLGNYEMAEQDINYIRKNAGGLQPKEITSSNALDELLYNKKYSLIWEYGHVWIDLRHYDRLDQLPTDNGDPYVTDVMPIPANECIPRDPTPEGCGAVEGI